MKLKSKVLAAVLFTFVAQSSMPRPAQAIMSVGTTSPILFVLGSVVFLGGSGGVSYGFRCAEENNKSCAPVAGFSSTVLGALAIGAGIIMLDERSPVSARLAALTPAKAKAFGVTESDRLAFNSEIDEANAVLESVAIESFKDARPSAARTHALWKANREKLSPGTFNALEKIALVARAAQAAKAGSRK